MCFDLSCVLGPLRCASVWQGLTAQAHPTSLPGSAQCTSAIPQGPGGPSDGEEHLILDFTVLALVLGPSSHTHTHRHVCSLPPPPFTKKPTGAQVTQDLNNCNRSQLCSGLGRRRSTSVAIDCSDPWKGDRGP